MVIHMFRKCNLKTKVYEPGEGGISYAMYFVGIITTIIMFAFFKFNADLFMIEQAIEQGVHIAETRALTSNQDKVDGTGMREDEYERELSRMHIITKYNTNQDPSNLEKGQIEKLATEFADALKDSLDLDGTHPQGQILKMMCGSDADILIDRLVIYEPVYSRAVTKVATGTIEGTSLETFDFNVLYTVNNWITYDINFVDNNYVGFSKSVKTAADVPRLTNGQLAEGATIEATVGASFAGVRNIFAGVDTAEPVVYENYYKFNEAYNNLTANAYDISNATTPIFSGAPTQDVYDVSVTQAVDIVIAHQDSRKQ